MTSSCARTLQELPVLFDDLVQYTQDVSSTPSLSHFVDVTKQAPPGVWLFLAYGLVVVVTWLAALLTDNLSQVDRLWSIIPVVWTGLLAGPEVRSLLAGTSVANPRLILMFGLACLWGLRLTYNFARKGGYSLTHEDYRWASVRKLSWLHNKFIYQLFNLLFVHAGQLMLLLLIVMPAYLCSQYPSELGPLDVCLALIYVSLLLCETIADQQQWRFHRQKEKFKASGEQLTGPYAAGFLSSGLFRLSRHPNYFCEMSIWWTFYLFSGVATGCFLNWTCIGAILYIGLFLGSCWITEKGSTAKYPLYKTYQQTTSMLVPWFPRKQKLQ